MTRPLQFALSRDPTTFIAGFSLWAFFESISLLWPGAAFDTSPVYRALIAWHLTENQWGFLMLADATALLLSLTMGKRRSVKSIISIFSGLGWIFYGAKLMEGAIAAGLFSPNAAWCICGGLGCLAATGQWIRMEWA